MLNEILEIQGKLEELIFEFDNKVRRNFITEAKFNVPLKDEITPLLILEGQINMHKSAIKAHEEGKGIDEIMFIVDMSKKQLINNTYMQQKKLLSYTNIMNNIETYSDEQFEELKALYKTLIHKHHPAITLIQSQEERNNFAILRELFLQCDLNGLKELSKTIQLGIYSDNGLTDEEALKEANIALNEFTNEYNRISEFDDRFLKLKEEVEDEMLLARNQASLRQRLYKAKKEIVELYEESNNLFGDKIDFDVVKTEE